MLRAERDLVRARLAASDGDQAAAASFAAAISGLRELSTPYHLAHGLLDHAEYLIRLGDADAAEAAISEARDIASRLRCQPSAGPRRSPDARRAPGASLVRAGIAFRALCGLSGPAAYLTADATVRCASASSSPAATPAATRAASTSWSQRSAARQAAQCSAALRLPGACSASQSGRWATLPPRPVHTLTGPGGRSLRLTASQSRIRPVAARELTTSYARPTT